MPGNAADNFVESLVASELLSPAQLDELSRNLSPQFLDPAVLARELVRRGWLTSLQARRILSGRGSTLRVGPYLLLENLGEGVTGKVYKARHAVANRLVALRLFNPALLAGPDAPRQLQRDVAAAARLEHPNLVRLLEASGSGATPYIAAEYVDGVDLGSLVRLRGPRATTEACGYVRQAALALEYAHTRGLTHGDVRPSHLILDRAGKTVKLLDLGLAHWRPEAQPPGNPFAAPEVVAGSPAGPAADVYALGAVLHALLAGRETAAGPLQPLEKLRRGVNPEVAALVARLTATRPEDRPGVGAVAEALGAFCGDDDDSVDFSMEGLNPVQASGITMAGYRPAPADDPTPYLGGVAEMAPAPVAAPTAPSKRSLSVELLVALAVLLVAAAVVFLAVSLSRPPAGARTGSAAIPSRA
jgi:serine/threonine-protein kinase